MEIKIQDIITIINGVLCEDVRPEPNGKWTLLGVFVGDIVVPMVPANIKLGVYFEATVDKPYKGALNVRVRINDAQMAVVTGQMDSEIGATALPIGGMIVNIPEAGVIHIDIGFDMENWTPALSKKLIVGEIAKA